MAKPTPESYVGLETCSTLVSLADIPSPHQLLWFLYSNFAHIAQETRFFYQRRLHASFAPSAPGHRRDPGLLRRSASSDLVGPMEAHHGGAVSVARAHAHRSELVASFCIQVNSYTNMSYHIISDHMNHMCYISSCLTHKK